MQRGDRVVLFDLRRGALVSSPEFGQSQFVEGDLGDQTAVFDAVGSNQIDTIFHLGAILSTNAEERPEDAWRANITGTRNVLEAARRFGCKRVIFSSTLATYGGDLPDPLPPDAPQWPASLYGTTKVAGERLGVYYHHRFGLDFRGIRFPALVAPRGAAGGASAFVSAVFEECVTKGGYTFYLEPTSRCPIVYVGDAVQALLKFHDVPPDRLTRRIYNIAGSVATPEMLAAVVHARLPQVKITYDPDPFRNAIVNTWPAHVDDSDAQTDWNWQATYDLERMADEIIRILQDDAD